MARGTRRHPMRFVHGLTAAVAAAALAFAVPRTLRADPEKPAPEEKETAKTPEEAWTQFQKAIAKPDKERIWALLGKESRAVLEKEIGAVMKAAEGEQKAEIAEEIGVTEEEFEKMTDKDLVIAMVLSAAKKDQNDIQNMKVTDIKIDGDKASAMRDESGKGIKEDARKAFFIKEDGEWKLDVKREMSDADGEAPPPPTMEPDEEDGEDDK